MMNNTPNRGDVLDANTVTISSGTETTIQTGISGLFLDLISVVICNTSATGVRVDLRDVTAGTVKLSLFVPPTDTRGVSFAVPKNQATKGTTWTAQLSTGVTDVRISAQFLKRI